MASTRERMGRPTQFHGVPLEERAVDSAGNRLPWALEWAEGHPNARHQKRQPEEKGSFGKSTLRKGSSRATRTQTPSKKENLTLDGFEQALKFDIQRSPQAQHAIGTQGATETLIQKPSLTKEPMQVMLYGYSPDNQWAAIHHYETVSGGIICEDYDRAPPAERRKYQGGFAYDGHIPSRPLTKIERDLAMTYAGGLCWIKVTFDSVEAARRAISYSPHLIQGYWVYAESYHGQAREPDEPILVRDEERQQGLLGGPKPAPRSQTLGASFLSSGMQRVLSSQRPLSTLPRSFAVNNAILEDPFQAPADDAESSTTASSATALDPSLSFPDLRERLPSQPFSSSTLPLSPISSTALLPNPATFTHFPETRRTVLRPAAEAFLPQPSWTERFFKSLTRSGLIPGDVWGNAVPRTEEGGFDWVAAGWYWRICYWLDGWVGTDMCGMKEG